MDYNQQHTLRIFTKADESYYLSVLNGDVILAPANPHVEHQHWFKEMKHSTTVNGEEGFPCFTLVNKATGQAIKHSIGATHSVGLVPYNLDYLDDSVLWTESGDTGDGFRCIHTANNIHLSFDAFDGKEDHGEVHDGTIVVLRDWFEGNSQRWKMEPWEVHPLVNISGLKDEAQAVHVIDMACNQNQAQELALSERESYPFLLRFPISAFGMCLGISSQAVLWKTLAISPPAKFLHVSPVVNLVLWYLSLTLTAVMALLYALKTVLYFNAVKREYYHHVRINFFFVPLITCLFLFMGVPPSISTSAPHRALWYVFMAPVFALELKIYGQWMFGGARRLSKDANPTNYLSIVGNFVGALWGASMGLKEGPLFFFFVGVAHYVVLFVTLYLRLPITETLPKDMHPVFFILVSSPSVASTAWATIVGKFDYCARIPYFTALFLYASLAVRINFFRGFSFSLAWWAYCFPMTEVAIATIHYAAEVESLWTQVLCTALTGISALSTTVLLVSTAVYAFVLRDLFPNDAAIPISKKAGSRKRLAHPQVLPKE